ncbi:MAG: RidA family protein [Verrucomicrobiaceae bacterium]|nr:RidA family protein [Verrucomicrobiaceae bacterium]
MKIISSPDAPAAVGPYSQAVRSGNLLFCSGQIPIDPATGKIEAPDVEGQIRQVIRNIRAVLAAEDLTLAQVVKSTMFLQDMADFPKVNPIYEAEFAGHKPARSTVQVARLPLGALVEIEVIAEMA